MESVKEEAEGMGQELTKTAISQKIHLICVIKLLLASFLEEA